MLTTHRLAKHYELTTLFTEVSFTVNSGERVALIGPNGSGKSTLLRLLAGVEAPDMGAITYNPSDLRVGYLPQGIAAPGSPLHKEQTVGAVLTHLMGDLPRLEAELTEIAEQLACHPNQTDLQTRYDVVLQRLAAAPDPNIVQRALAELGLLALDPNLTVAALSGGQQTRLLLAQVLLAQPQLLLLDEPTNHLDGDTLAWLEDWLANFSGAVLLVSHDRAFLDNTVTRVLDLDPTAQTVRAYPGNYSDYVEQVLAEREQQWDAYRHQETEIRRMHTDIVNTRNQALHVERTTKPNQPTVRRLAKKVAKKAKSRERKLDRYIASDERVEKPKAGWQIKVDFASPESSRQAVVLEQLAVGFDPSAPLLHGLSQVLYAGDRVALIGPNGSGKTTLLRTLIGELPPLAGSLRTGPSVQLGYLSQAQTQFAPETTPVQAIQQVVPWGETETRNFLHYYLFSGDEALKPVVQLSFGQRTRLELARLVATGCNCLLLDEPINHLDIPSRSLFEQALARFEGAVLVVTHDRYFVQRFATRLWQVHGQTLVET